MNISKREVGDRKIDVIDFKYPFANVRKSLDTKKKKKIKEREREAKINTHPHNGFHSYFAHYHPYRHCF